MELDHKLTEILGSSNVYFQPPSTLKLRYNCIIYKRVKIAPVHADNKIYKLKNCYNLTVIYRDPDSELPLKILRSFSLISHDTYFVADGLHHDVFTLYY